MTEKSIPEMLARLEREHVPNIYHPNRCAKCESYDGFEKAWPCERARLVAHARSLEAALLDTVCYAHRRGAPDEARCLPPERTTRAICRSSRAALGEAQ